MTEIEESSILITGANGQLGTELRQKYPNAKYTDSKELDITDVNALLSYDWSDIKIIINTAAYTDVDGAETVTGRKLAWQINSAALKNIYKIAKKHSITIVHISTDYVFDGTISNHKEKEPFTPLNVYGASKASGDQIISLLSKHYIIRTSWVIGSGKNFVRTMLDLGKKGINPSVVNDQIGRLTFTGELVNAIDHLLSVNAPYGTYNVSNGGEPASWADIARQIFKLAGLTNIVTSISTDEYYKGKDGIAPRPLSSTFDLAKLQNTGFSSTNWQDDLAKYISSLE